MGEPKFSRPKFDTPPHPWKKARIEEEHLIQANHGLKNMREIWKAKSQLRRHRRQAMRLIGMIDTTEGHGMREKDYVNNVPYWMVNRAADVETGNDIHLTGQEVKLTLEEDINRLRTMKCYRGVRHASGNKVRGQRGRSNGRGGLTLGVSRKKA